MMPLSNLWWAVISRATVEGVIAFGFAWLVVALLPRAGANLRCWVWRLAYLKLLVALLVWRPIEVPVLNVAPTPLPPQHGRAVRMYREDFEVRTSAPTQPAAAAPPAPSAPPRPILPAGGWAALGFAVWLIGAAALTVRFAVQALLLRRWRQSCRPVGDEASHETLRRLCEDLGIRKPPALLAHASQGPLVVGGLRPAIVAPEALLAAGGAELRLALTHELAHLKRRDPFWNGLTAVAHVLFFFHPGVWLARREYRLAEEAACDELTIARAGASAREYGELLLRVATAPRNAAVGWGALGVLGNGMNLERRLGLLQNLGKKSRRQALLGGAVVGAAALVGLAPWKVVAQTETSPPPAAGAGAGPASAASQAVDASVEWEDMLLLQATRYLRLSSAQVQQLLPVARTANRKLTGLQDKEAKVLDTLRRTAVRQREAIVAGRTGSLQEQADAIQLRETAKRARAETEGGIVNESVTALARLLSPKQVERAFLLTNGAAPEGEIREVALLDPSAGFVAQNEGFGGPGARVTRPLPGGAAGGAGVGGGGGRVFANPGAGGENLTGQLMALQEHYSGLQRQLTDPGPPPGTVGVFVRQEGDGPPMVFKFGSPADGGPPLPPGAQELDLEGFRRQLAQEAENTGRQIRDLRRRIFSGNGAEANPAQYEDLLRHLARRMFLSPRLQDALERRSKGGN